MTPYKTIKAPTDASGEPHFASLTRSLTWVRPLSIRLTCAWLKLKHERSSTTLDLYTRRTEGHDRILRALTDDDDDPDDDGPTGALVPTG